MRQVAGLGEILLQVDKVDHQPLQGAVSWPQRRVLAGWMTEAAAAGETLQPAAPPTTTIPPFMRRRPALASTGLHLTNRHPPCPAAAPCLPACLQADTVLIQTRVSVMNNTPCSSNAPNGLPGEQELLGSFADTFCVRLASLDNMLPGSGFALHNHMFRWIRPIAVRRQGMLGRDKCRVQ